MRRTRHAIDGKDDDANPMDDSCSTDAHIDAGGVRCPFGRR